MQPARVMVVAGARPNFMKVAPILKELEGRPGDFEWRLVHTGQHYDAAMSDVFFRELGIPQPQVHLGVGSGSHAQQTAAIMATFEPVLLDWHPDVLVVVGDVNSTLACALVAAKLSIPVAHVEAGLRSFDRTMPEEINRVVTDHVADMLFVTEEAATANLEREGIAPDRILFVGNVMIDTLTAHRAAAERLDVPAQYGLVPGKYVLLTLHRPSNVDDPVVFDRLLQGLARIGRDLPIIFPVHPRTRPAIARSARAVELAERGALHLIEPLGYLEFLGLMAASRAVLTDSGGIQEETTVLGVPCLTLRENTERPVTVTAGTNQLVGTQASRIIEAWENLQQAPRPATTPPLWDGHAARRIADLLAGYVSAHRARLEAA